MRNPPNEPLAPDSIGGGSARASGPGSLRAPGSASAGSERKCVLSGEHGSRENLLRLAISPEGLVLPDIHARAPGRGAWIGVTRAQLEAAMAKGQLRGALQRAFKGATLTVPEDLPAMIEAALTRALLDRLGLEMRAGRLILGAERIAEQARAGRVAWLGHAANASADGMRKLDQAFRIGHDAEGSGLGGTCLPLDRMALSVALGRDNVVHLALADGESAERVAVPLRRLLHFTGAAPAACEYSARTAEAAVPGSKTIPDTDRVEAN